jgi:hypothetical protein
MAVDVGVQCRDPTLYRMLSFYAWSPQEREEESAARLKRIEDMARALGWLPQAQTDSVVQIPFRPVLAWQYRKLWDDGWTAVDEGWLINRFAQASHETLTVLLGVAQDGACAGPEGWVDAVRGRWAAAFGPDEQWTRQVALPTATGGDDRPQLLGQLWLWTGEWAELPGTSWEAFGRVRYGTGCVVFPWGVLGAGEPLDETPCFELHTSVAQKEERDRFLYGQPSLAFVEFVKATQFLGPRYARTLAPVLNTLERDVLDKVSSTARATEPAVSDASDEVIRVLTQLLREFSRRLFELEYDWRDVELARTVIEDIMRANSGTCIGGSDASPLLGPVARYDQQLRSELAYFHVSEQAGLTALRSQQTLVDMENTRAEHRLAGVEHRLGVVALIVGTTIALAHVLEPGDWHWLIGRLAVVAVGAIAATGYYFWPRKTEK